MPASESRAPAAGLADALARLDAALRTCVARQRALADTLEQFPSVVARGGLPPIQAAVDAVAARCAEAERQHARVLSCLADVNATLDNPPSLDGALRAAPDEFRPRLVALVEEFMGQLGRVAAARRQAGELLGAALALNRETIARLQHADDGPLYAARRGAPRGARAAARRLLDASA